MLFEVLLSMLIVGVSQAPAPRPPNILILIVDDVGVDRIQAYGYRNGEGALIAPLTPNIDKLAARGLLFRNAWSAPLCSPARAMALTGKYPCRTGVGRAVGLGSKRVSGMSANELCIADTLPEAYASAIIGKWHLASRGALGGVITGEEHPIRCGFDVFSGVMGNLGVGDRGYTLFRWLHASQETPGAFRQSVQSKKYITTYTSDEALQVIDEFGEQPWLVWVAYNSAHKPLHPPPEKLVASTGLDQSTKLGQGKAMIEAMDLELGRLLNGIDGEVLANTTILFFGDNGTQKDLIESPFDPSRGKGTLYNGGVQIPLIVCGPSLPAESEGVESQALVDLTDLFPTICELVGSSPPTGIDGKSFAQVLREPHKPSSRGWIYSERFEPNFLPVEGESIGDRKLKHHRQAARDRDYKLIRRRTFDKKTNATSDVVEFYHLVTDPDELHDLLDGEGQPPLDARKNFDGLMKVLDQMVE